MTIQDATGTIQVGAREFCALQDAAWDKGVPLRVCNAPVSVVLAARVRHERARRFRRGHEPMGIREVHLHHGGTVGGVRVKDLRAVTAEEVEAIQANQGHLE